MSGRRLRTMSIRLCFGGSGRIEAVIYSSSTVMPIVEVLAILQTLFSGTTHGYMHGELTAIGRPTEEENMAMGRKCAMSHSESLNFTRSPVHT